MSKIKLANELKRLLPGQDNSRIRQAIMEAYQRATGAPSLNPVYYQSSITNIVQQIVTEGSAAENGLIKLDKTRLGGEIIQDTELYILEGRDYNLITSSVTGVGAMGGKYYLACQVDGAYTVVRINADFTLDHQYGIFNNVVNDIAVNADGTMFATGKFTTYNDVSYNRAVKLHPDGTVDATFNIGTGFNAGAAPFTNVQNARVTILDDNSVIFCGQFTSYNGVTRGGIIRLNQDGTLFSTWNDGVGIAGASRIIWNGRKQADGKIVVTGLFTSYNGLSLPSAPVDGYNALFRINADGTLDTAFAPQMFYGIDFIPVEIRPDGKILVAGSLGQIVQYNPDGTMDQGFNGGNNFTGTITDPSSGQVLNLELLSNGDVLASGNMTLMDDTVKNLIKIDPSGSIVSEFDTKFNGTVLDTITDEAANLIIAFTGKNSNPSISTTYFTEYDGVPINDFAELTLDTAVLFTEKKGVDLVYEKGLLKYKGKYHEYYDSRTLPDKEYVDEKISQVSSEGSPAVDNLLSTSATLTLSANQGRILKGFIDTINGVLSSDDTTLDELQEIVNYIKQNKTELDTLGIPNIAGLVDALAAKVDILSIIDNLTSTLADAPLSANQGRVLKGLIDTLSGTLSGKVNTADIVDALTSVAVNLPLSANQGRELKALIDAINLTLASNDPALNTLQEVVTLLKSHETTLGNLGVADVSGLQGVLDLKVNIAAIVDNLTSTLADAPLSANQGRILKGFIDNINTLLASDDTTLDELQEIVNYIKQNKTDLDTLGIPNIAGLVDALAAKVDILSIIDNLTSTLANAPLSANQGRVLKGLIDTLSGTLSGKVNTADIVDALNSVAVNLPLSANQGRELKALIDAINLTLASNDPALNTLQEVVTLLKTHETTLGNLGVADVSGLQGVLDLKVNIAAIVDNLTSTLADAPLSANQGRILKGFIDNINTLLASDDTTLDELQEIVNFIKQNKSELDTLGIPNIAGLVDALFAKISGSGTENYLAKFDATGKAISDSPIFDGFTTAALTGIGIGTNTPGRSLHINHAQAGIHLQDSGSTAVGNVAFSDIRAFDKDGLWMWRAGSRGTGDNTFLIKTLVSNGDIVLIPHGTGKVGIGTEFPEALLHIIDNGTGWRNPLIIENEGDPLTGATRFEVKNTASHFILQAYGSTAPGALASAASIIATGNASKLLLGAGLAMPVEIFTNNNYASPAFILGVDQGLSLSGTLKIATVNNAVGDILHISPTGVVTKRTLLELKNDLNITIDTSNLVKLTGPPQNIESQIFHKYSLKTEGAYMLEANPVIYNGAGYASINYLNSFRWYFSRHDADIHAVIDLVDLTQSVVLKWPTSGGTIATIEGQPFDDSGTYIAITKSIQESSDPDSKLITDAEAQTKIDDQIPDSNEYQMGLDAVSGAAIIRTHNLPASGTPNWKTSGFYGSPDSPLSGSLATVDLVQARNTTITIYHKAAVEPAWPDYTYKKGEAYSTTDLNIIHFRYHASTLLVAYIETIPYASVDITSGLLFNFFHHDSDHVWDGVAATGSMEDHAGLGDAAVYNPGTLSWVSGQVNRACYLGTTLNFTPYSYLKVPTTAARAALTNVFTWASWITYPEVNAASSDFLVTDGIGQRGIYIQSANDNDRIECILDRNFVTPDSSTTRLRLNGIFVPGVPVHIAFRYSGTRIYGYVNGAWAGTTGADYVSPGLGNSSDYMINSSPQETGGWGSFIMERTRLYNRGLTDAEISALANETI